MPDITICINKECHMRKECKRHESHWGGKFSILQPVDEFHPHYRPDKTPEYDCEFKIKWQQ